MRRAIPFLAATIACGGCGLGELIERPRALPAAAGWTVGLEEGPERPRLVVRRRAGNREATATTAGVRLVLADGTAAELPFARQEAAGDTLRVQCADQVAEHTVSLAIVQAGDRLHVRVEDEVELASEVAELSIEFTLATGELAAHESFVPLTHGPDEVAGDVAWRTPLAFVRAGQQALAVLPEVDTVRPRILPGALELSADGAPPRIRHGIVAQRVTAEGGLLTCRRDPGLAKKVAGQSIGFGLELRMWVDARPQQTLADLAREMWQKVEARAGRRAVALAAQAARVLAARGRVAALGAGKTAEPTEVRFTVRENALLLAAGLAATRDPAALADARRLVELAVAAPQRSGLSPDRALIGMGRAQWSHGRDVRQLPDGEIYDGTAVAWTRVCGLWATAGLPADDPVRQAAVQAAEAAARFFLANQRDNGAIPALYEPAWLAPVQSVLYEPAAEVGAIALLLAECAALGLPDAEKLRAGALAAILYLRREVQPEHAWYDRSALPEAGAPRGRGTMALVFAVLAAMEVHAQVPSHAGLYDAAAAFVDDLILQQQVWSPVWLAPEPSRSTLIGGFGRNDGDPTWSDPVQALAALALLRAYDQIGGRDLLQRGAAALHAALASAPALRDDALDAMSDVGMAAAVAQLVLARFGSAVLDLTRGTVDSIDAVRVAVAGSAPGTSFMLTAQCHPALAGRAVVTVRGLPKEDVVYPVVANGRALGSFTAAQLRAGIELPATPVPRADLAPPAMLQIGQPTPIRLVFASPPPPGFTGRVFLDVQDPPPGSPAAQRRWWAPLRPVGDGTVWQSEQDFVPPENLPRNARLRGRAELVGPSGQRVTVLAVNETAMGSETILDVAGRDDTDCLSGERAPRVLFADGARLARMATAEEPLVWELRVPPRSLSLELDILLAGRMRLHANDHLIYEDPPSTPAVVRRARIEISDRRLWEAGTLRLSFADAGGGAAGTALQVAELRTRVVRDVATGIVPDTEAEPLPEPVDVTTRTERSAPPDARLTLLVVPVVLADAPLALSRDQIAEVCFGEGHRQTPGPQPRLTSGSVREILHELSGGRTHLVGEVADPKTEHIQAVELTGADGPSRIAALVERALAAHGREYDVVLVVHSGVAPNAERPTWLRLGGLPPIAMIAERAPDQSLLPVGEALSAILAARYGIPRRSLPAVGNFGELALSTEHDPHLPAAPLGVDLVRAGWADYVDIVDRIAEVTAGSTQHERRIHRLPTRLPDRGNLLLEVRGSAAGEPRLAHGGLLAYWELHRPPLVRGRDGEIAYPRTLRLARDAGATETPFVPGTIADLVRSAQVLDDTSSPSLATPEGELCFLVREVGPAPRNASDERGDRVGFSVERLDHRLLDREPLGTIKVSPTDWTPIAIDGVDRGLGSMMHDGGALAISVRRRPLRASWPVPPSFGRGLRLFGEGRVEHGAIRLRVGADQAVVFDATLSDPAAPLAFTVDLPPAGLESSIWVEIEPAGASEAGLTFTNLVVVPRARASHSPLRALKGATAKLADGRLHAPVLALTTGENGRATLYEPILVPAHRSMLRLRCALGADAAPDTSVTLDVVLRSIDGSVSHTLLPGHEITRGEGDRPVLTALLAIPASERPFVGVLSLLARGKPGTTLWIVDAEVARP